MALTLDQLQGQLDALKQVRSRGLRTLDYAGQRVEYRTDTEIAAAIAAIEGDIARLNGDQVVRRFRFSSSKDL